MPLTIRRAPEREARERARAMLAEVGLAHRVEHRPGELSGGERQRVAVARLLLHRPDVIILDDAMTALDENTRAELLAALRETVPDAAILNVGQSHRTLPGIGRTLTLERQQGGTVLGHEPQPYDPKRPLTADL